MTDRKAYLRRYKRTRKGPTPHGTQDGYANYSCRCEPCRAAHRDHVAAWRKRHAQVTLTNADSVTPR